MYLKALEINGFKSFAVKGHFDFTSQISGIVGPNGSGKSNVAEAFRFVLGEQSLKNMRSKKGHELIFAGKGGNLNRASVKVTLDNSKKVLDIDYSEVVIERVVLRDGTNEYFINQNKVRAKDVVELLAGANIGSTGHHIISQGEADKILMISPRERKQVIEEALGLKVFTIKKSEAERKLAKTQDNLKEVKMQERSNAPRLSFLKREVEKIEKARELREELRGLYKLYFPQRTLIENEKKAREGSIAEVSSTLQAMQGEIDALQSSMEDSSSKDAQEKLAQEYQELRVKLSGLESQKNELERESGKLEALIELELAKQKKANEVQVPSDRKEALSAAMHQVWMKWAQTLLSEETLSQERTERWQSRMVAFKDLPEESKGKSRAIAEFVMEELGEESASKVVEFDPQALENHENRRIEVLELISKLAEEAEPLKVRMDEIEREQANPESANQKVQIQILELEKAYAAKHSEYRDMVRKNEEADSLLSRFNSEEVLARELFAQEVDQFINEVLSEQTELNIQEKIIRTRALLENAGNITTENAAEEYQELARQSEYIKEQITDLESSAEALATLTADLEAQIEEKFRAGMEHINASFNEFFKTLFSGGSAELSVINVPLGKAEDEEMQEYELGVDMKVHLPNKKVSSLSMLSGGERSLTSIALLFAMSQVAPPPFIILDETDAALDEANSKRYGDMVEKLAEHSQLIVITHNRETMSRSGILYGVTMGDDGASRLLSVSLEEAEAVAK